MAAGLAGVVVLAAGGYLLWGILTGPPTSVPSCSWPLQVRGAATNERAGLIRCYLKALAEHDTRGLLAVADTTTRPVHITAADFAHAADARSGTATATFKHSEMDYTFSVVIQFADHAREIVVMELANPSSSHSWRLGIGTPNGHEGPPPANPSQ